MKLFTFALILDDNILSWLSHCKIITFLSVQKDFKNKGFFLAVPKFETFGELNKK